MSVVSVAIPVKDGREVLDGTLAAVRAQRLPDGIDELELVVCDSGSRDGSAALARQHGAAVIEIAPSSFSHGGTRNLLMERSAGEHVAFLTQDAEPADGGWLAALLGGFAAADDVALAFGPYRPRPGATPMVARELTEWFASFSPDGSIRIDRLSDAERTLPPIELLGRRGFFTDANGCVARAAWDTVRFRPVAYAEDHVLAHDMLRAGYAKAYVPGAGVLHSHEYSGWGWLRRSFDEARALREVYGLTESASPRAVASKVAARARADARWASEHGDRGRVMVRSAYHHAARATGAILGSRARRLPPALTRALSSEGRAQ
jgi:rhamnosyltransferase